MPRLLFLVHGMGVHGQDWATPTVAHLVKLPETYGYSWFTANGPLDTHVEFHPISYDAVFTRLLDDWDREVTKLSAFAALHGVSVSRLVGFLATASETEKNFFWTHVVDVLLYRVFQIVAAEVRLRVRLDIVKALTTATAGGTIVGASVLGHSLGTSVSHDSLAILGTQPIDTDHGPNEAFMVGNFSFDAVYMVANVSRVLETSPKVFESVVHPFTVRPQTAYVGVYQNFRHRFDPFAAVRSFSPQGWGDAFIPVEGFDHVQDFNVHDLDLYLENPRVHVPILRQLLGDKVVTEAERAAATAKYDATPEPPCPAELREFKKAIDRIIAEFSGSTDPQDIAIAVIKFLAAAKEAKDACV